MSRRVAELVDGLDAEEPDYWALADRAKKFTASEQQELVAQLKAVVSKREINASRATYLAGLLESGRVGSILKIAAASEDTSVRVAAAAAVANRAETVKHMAAADPSEEPEEYRIATQLEQDPDASVRKRATRARALLR